MYEPTGDISHSNHYNIHVYIYKLTYESALRFFSTLLKDYIKFSA